MPRVKLTDRSVQAIRPNPSRQVDYFDARFPGFGLRVSPAGRKSWSVMYRFHGRQRRFTLGPYPYVSLADARMKAKVVMSQVIQGTDPAAVKAAERMAETFAELAAEYLERHAKPRKRTWREDEGILKRELLPHWGRMKAKEITRRDVRLLVDKILERGVTIHANRIFGLARKVFNFALQRDIVEANPCHGLPQPAREHRRDRVLSEEEIGTVWKEFEAERPLVAATLKLRLLTAQRGGEITGMRWDHIDFTSGWWTIPPELAKNGMAHRVPLSRQVRAILAEIKLMGISSTLVFPSPSRTGAMRTTQKAAERIRTRTGIDFRQHDLRRTAASHMTGMGISRLVVGKLLNHVEPGVTAVYDRHSYDREKREALEAWGERLEKIVAARTDAASSQFDTNSVEGGAGSAPAA
jgi:integrase